MQNFWSVCCHQPGTSELHALNTMHGLQEQEWDSNLEASSRLQLDLNDPHLAFELYVQQVGALPASLGHLQACLPY